MKGSSDLNNMGKLQKYFISEAHKSALVESALKLRNLSKTRWTARVEAIKSIWSSFNITIEVLDEIKNADEKFD